MLWIVICIMIGGTDGGRSATTSASSVVEAWRGLSWHLTLAVTPDADLAAGILQKASGLDIHARIHLELPLLPSNISQPIVPLTIFNLVDENLNFISAFFSGNDYPSYSLMLVHYKYEMMHWNKFKLAFEKLAKPRALYRLILNDDGSIHKISLIMTFLHEDRILELEVIKDQTSGIFKVHYDLQGETLYY
jgi:hypothetical protein